MKNQFAMRNTYEKSAVELCYVKTAVRKQYERIRNEELLQHRALSKSRHPEDSMGGDIVEGPVVFPLWNTTRYGSSTR